MATTLPNTGAMTGKTYEILIPANTYSPTACPAGWKEIE